MRHNTPERATTTDRDDGRDDARATAKAIKLLRSSYIVCSRCEQERATTIAADDQCTCQACRRLSPAFAVALRRQRRARRGI